MLLPRNLCLYTFTHNTVVRLGLRLVREKGCSSLTKQITHPTRALVATPMQQMSPKLMCVIGYLVSHGCLSLGLFARCLGPLSFSMHQRPQITEVKIMLSEW